MEEVVYKKLAKGEMCFGMIKDFNRYQKVTKCWRKVDGQWVLRDINFVETWDEQKLQFLVKCIEGLYEDGGATFAAIEHGKIVGFAALEADFFGSDCQYLELTSLHTSYEHRGQGIGRKLFEMVCEDARLRGAKKLYISTHSAQETQAFYKAVGCVEALEYNEECVAEEPFDCQLERELY